ncbi:MAG: aminopeptidase P family protein [Bacteroidia bacterium]|nr:aminopeptidase P family protein [Bacteroidia bacterium]
MFAPDIYRQRRSALLSLLSPANQGLLLFLGNEESPMNYRDNVYKFRQDSTFLYFFGIDRPGMNATIDLADGSATLYGEEMTIDHVIWMGPQPSLQELAESSGGLNIATPEALPARISRGIGSNEPLHYLPAYRGDSILNLIRWCGKSQEALAAGVSEAFIRAVVALRSIKSSEELVQLEQACSRTATMHITGMKTAKPGLRESDVMAAVRRVPLSMGADTSFPIICSKRGEVLHNHHHDNLLRSGDLLLLDAGSESDLHYAGDMTRTFPVDATFTQKQREIYEIVLGGMETAFGMIKPGIAYRDVHLAAARSMTEGLQQLGLMKGDLDESVAAGAHGVFFPHGLGHMMGLDVHDMEDLGEKYVGYTDEFTRSTQLGLKSLRLARHLQEGFVLTVEPGIYFIPPLIEKWKATDAHSAFINYDKLEAYYSFGGVRIEDDVLVTKDGYKILGTPAPKSVREVEEMRQEAFS